MRHLQSSWGQRPDLLLPYTGGHFLREIEREAQGISGEDTSEKRLVSQQHLSTCPVPGELHGKQVWV
jgi:hypothetical protein